MYFWRIKKLKSDLVVDLVSERDLFIYVFISAVAYSILMEAWVLFPSEDSNTWDQVSSLVNVVIVAIGTYCCYRANGAAHGSDFLKRYISISFVMTIRLMFFGALLFIPLMVYYFMTINADSDLASTAVDTVPFWVLNVLYYWRVCFHISDVNSHNMAKQA